MGKRTISTRVSFGRSGRSSNILQSIRLAFSPEVHVNHRADLRSRGAVFNDQLEAYLADDLRRLLARIDDVLPELEVYVELVASFYKLHGRDPRGEEFTKLVADARMLAAGDAVSEVN